MLRAGPPRLVRPAAVGMLPVSVCTTATKGHMRGGAHNVMYSASGVVSAWLSPRQGPTHPLRVTGVTQNLARGPTHPPG